jgi:16S rRNA G1207 methylase RsmC
MLNANGDVYVVCINGLRKFIARTLIDIFGNAKKLKQGKVYTVIRATKA